MNDIYKELYQMKKKIKDLNLKIEKLQNSQKGASVQRPRKSQAKDGKASRANL